MRHGVERPLGAKVGLPLEPGDVLTIQTPGGGGYGAP
jgi:N-methylhydantoinase B/oxoprolinase/acetone carboxylase alpha subunit